MRLKTLVVLVGGFMSSSITLHAESVTLSQKGRLFSSDSITIKKGDTVNFTNDDNVPHNAISTSPGNEFDIGAQLPGANTPVTFDSVGDVNVVCGIHPRMKMTIHVNN